MQALTERLLGSELRAVFTDGDLEQLLAPASPDRRYGLVKRALASGELVRVRKGLYVPAARFLRHPVDVFSLASRIYGPSYVSLESALALHGLIPEQVAVTTSGCFARSRTFVTPLGSFEFRHTPCRTLVGVSRVAVDEQTAYLLATPLRALVDLAHDRLGLDMGLEFLVHSLRVDEQELRTRMHRKDLASLLEELPRGRARTFALRLRRELWS